MATNKKKKNVTEGIKPVSDQRQKELEQAAKAKKQKTGSTAKSGPMKKESVDKFQQMLEYLVNEDQEKAESLFHDIVVEKSRQIYEDLLAEELADDEIEEADEEEVEESDEDEEVAEDFDLDEFDVEEAPMGGDPADDMEMDMDADDMDADDMEMDMDADGDEPATQDDIKDLEAELADLKAEFEELMSDMDGDEDMDMGSDEGDDDMDMDDENMDKESVDNHGYYEENEVEESDDEEVEESDDEEVEESQPLSVAEQMREYVEKVTAKMGDAGAGEKSPVAGPNHMGGGTSANIAQGGDESGMTPAKPKEDDAGNVNTPGGKASKSMKAMPKGHGAEKKGAPEGAADKKSMIGS